jgi:hypothetical protein
LKFLPSSGTPAWLPTGQLINPIGYKNTLAGQLVTAILNVGFDSANTAFAPATGRLGNLVLVTGALRGYTVNQVIDIANRHIGGCLNTYSPSQLNYILTQINENYLEGRVNNCYLACPVNGVDSRTALDLQPASVMPNWNVYPNPASALFTVSFDSRDDGSVLIEMITLTSGQSSVLFNG